VAPGAAAYLTVAQNFNHGWVAHLGNQRLDPVRVDGWEQGWVVPAGSGGTIVMTYQPDLWFRLGMLIGALMLALLALLALLPGRGNTPATAERRVADWVVALAGVAVLVLIGGPLALLVVPLYVVGRRFGSNALAVVAGGSFVAAGIVVAIQAGSPPQSHLGAFGSSAQLASVLAVSSVIVALVLHCSANRIDGRPGDSARSEAAGVHPGRSER
jgi:arabinofuranan 3-O-arabinosyltransferase